MFRLDQSVSPIENMRHSVKVNTAFEGKVQFWLLLNYQTYQVLSSYRKQELSNWQLIENHKNRKKKHVKAKQKSPWFLVIGHLQNRCGDASFFFCQQGNT